MHIKVLFYHQYEDVDFDPNTDVAFSNDASDDDLILNPTAAIDSAVGDDIDNNFDLWLALTFWLIQFAGIIYKVLIDCTGEPFAHGHAYVAFSKVRDCNNVRVFVNKDQLHEIGIRGRDLELMPFITNIVYQDYCRCRC